MKKKTEKEILLEALKTIKGEYIRKVHITQVNTCALCKIYNRNYCSCLDCGMCPMTIFEGLASYKCMNRECQPVNSTIETNEDKHLAVVEFYNRFIKKVSKMTEEQFKNDNWYCHWKSLRTIDKNVAKKFGVFNTYGN